MSPELRGIKPNQRPPYRYIDGSVDFNLLCKYAGLDTETYLVKDFLALEGMPALYELFSDGELRVVNLSKTHEPATARTNPDGSARHGEFYEAFARLLNESVYGTDPTLTDELNKLARFSGRVLAQVVSEGIMNIPSQSQIEPRISASGSLEMNFARWQWTAEHSPAVVLEFGPGLVGKRFIDLQIDSLSMVRPGSPPALRYIPVSDGPFVNEFLMSYSGHSLKQKYGEGSQSLLNDYQLLVGREDGMLQAGEAISAVDEGICDLIIMCGVHNANKYEVESTFPFIRRLMKDTGKMMLSAPLPQVHTNATTFAQQLKFAKDAGLKIDWQAKVSSGDAKLGTQTTSGCAVLSKAA